MELFEQIRRKYEYGGGTIRGIAKKLGIHRRMVREAVLSAVPMERKTPVRERPKLEPAMAFIDAILEADRKAPRKQRHTAHRIWCRIRAEMPEVKVAESTIRRHVRERKMKLLPCESPEPDLRRAQEHSCENVRNTRRFERTTRSPRRAY